MIGQIDYVIFVTGYTSRITSKRPLIKEGKIVPNKYGIVGIFDKIWSEKNPKFVIDNEKIESDLEEIQKKCDISYGSVVVKKTITKKHKLICFVRDYLLLFLQRMCYCHMSISETRCRCECDEQFGIENEFVKDSNEYKDGHGDGDYDHNCEIKEFDKSLVEEDVENENENEDGKCEMCMCTSCLTEWEIDFGMCIEYKICDNFIVITMDSESG